MNKFKGTLILTKSNLKRDAFRLSIWIISLTLISFALIAAYSTMMSDDTLKEMIIMRATNPAIRMLDSPSPGYSLGGFYTSRGSVLITILIIAMTIQTIIKHTRDNEESGVSELISSTMVGRYAPLLSAVIISVLTNIFVVIITTVALYSHDLDLLYSFYTGISFGLMGLFMTGVMAIAVQISQTTSGASKFGWLTTLFFFTISAIGNLLGKFDPNTFKVESHNITFLSPFGWYQQMYVFHENNMYLIIPFIISFIVLLIIGFKLINKRDIGSGLIPAKKGRKDAKKSLLSPLGLFRNLGKKSYTTWFITIVLFGLLFGFVSDEFEEGLSSIEGLEYIFGSVNSTEYFLALIISIVIIPLLIFYVQSLLRIRKEEVDNTIENILASGVTRRKLLITKIVESTLNLYIILLFLVIGIYVGGLTKVDIGISVILQSAFMNSIPILLVGSIVILAFGILPKYVTLITYGVTIISVGLGPVFGPMFNLGENILKISPFTHIPTPLDDFNIMPFIIMSILIVVMTFFGFKGFENRNLDLN